MENTNNQYGDGRKRPQSPEEIDRALRHLHHIFASVYRKGDDGKPVRAFPGAYAIGLFHNVISRPMSMEEVVSAAVQYGEAMSN